MALPDAMENAVVLGGVESWVFDLDNTLYPAHCNLFAQIDLRMRDFITRFLDVDRATAYRIQKRYFRDHGTTLNGLMLHHGLDPKPYLEYVHDIDVTAIPQAPGMVRALTRLPGRKLVYTNGSTRHAENVLGHLGIGHLFDGIFDIAAAGYVPKPQPAAYRMLVKRHAIAPRQAVMIEDIAANLEPAAALGMTTVWVRTASVWGCKGSDGEHVHHVVDDLAGWLEGQAAAGGS